MHLPARRLTAFIELARPVNAVIALVGVVVGAVLGARRAGWTSAAIWGTVAVSLATALILAAGNALNDACDVEIDRVNRPNRPIPSSRLTRRDAVVFAVGCVLVGWTLAWGVGAFAFVVSVVAAGLLAVYALMLKRTALGGNLVVGALASGAVFAGGVAVNSPAATSIPALFVFVFTVAREILKDVEDVEGDRRGGARTAVVRWGIRRALGWVTFFTGMGVLFSPVPYAMRMDGFGIRYLALVLVGVDGVLVMALASVWRDPTPEKAGRAQRWFKLGSVMGLVAVLTG